MAYPYIILMGGGWMKYKMLVTDIDGTITDKDHNIVPLNRKAIEKAQELGLYVTLATGRRPESAKKFVDELNIECPVIVYNGAGIYDYKENSFLYKEVLDRESSILAISLLNKYTELSVFLYYDHGSYTKEENETVREYIKKDKIELIYEEDLLSIVKKEAPIKIMIIGERSLLDRFYEEISHYDTSVNFTNSEINYLEILPKNASKGNMLRILTDKLNIKLEEVIAVGDKDNDISMIEISGKGVAVGNASPLLKEKADYIAPPGYEGGVWDVVEKFLLNRL